MVFGISSSRVQMWELDHKEGWAPKNWCFWTVVLEKTLESLLDCKEIQPVHPKGNQSWIFTGRTDAEAETLILWPPNVMSRLIGKDLDAGKDWGQEVKGITEAETVGWHHQLNGHESEQTLGDGDVQGSRACYSPWGCKALNTIEWLNKNNSYSYRNLWLSDVIQRSHPLSSPSPPKLNLSQNQGLFKWFSSWQPVAKGLELQDLLSLGWTGLISLQSKGLWRVSSNTTVQKHQFFSAQLF